MKDMKDKTPREYAIDNMASHKYTQLSSSPCEAWECSKPGSSTYAFTIMVSRMGIAVVGDIDGLTFGVGSSYGIPFLAGDSVDYYIHSKLESHCKETELDEESFRGCAIDAVFCSMRINEDENTPEWIVKEDYSGRLDDAIRYLEALEDSEEYIAFLEDVRDCGSLDEVSDLVHGHTVVDWYEWYDCRLEQPSFSLLTRLHMVNIAAQEIMKIKFAEDK